MTQTVTVYADLLCPWAAVAVHRLRWAREAGGFDVVFEPRAWPLEWVNAEAHSRDHVEAVVAVLSTQEPDLFSRYDGESFPSTSMPAFELVAAARRLAGARAAEEVDSVLRQRVFRDSEDISVRHVLESVAEEAQELMPESIRASRLIEVWLTEPVRADVEADFTRAQELSIEGSPQVFWPDGTTTYNPGMHDVEFERGLPRLGRVDPDACERLLLDHVA